MQNDPTRPDPGPGSLSGKSWCVFLAFGPWVIYVSSSAPAAWGSPGMMRADNALYGLWRSWLGMYVGLLEVGAGEKVFRVLGGFGTSPEMWHGFGLFRFVMFLQHFRVCVFVHCLRSSISIIVTSMKREKEVSQGHLNVVALQDKGIALKPSVYFPQRTRNTEYNSDAPRLLCDKEKIQKQSRTAAARFRRGGGRKLHQYQSS